MRKICIWIDKKALTPRAFIYLIYISMFLRVGLLFPIFVRQRWSGGADGGDSSFKILWNNFGCNYAMFWVDYYSIRTFIRDGWFKTMDVDKFKIFRSWGIDKLYSRICDEVNIYKYGENKR